MSDALLTELERFCRDRIPVAAAMQLSFVSFDGDELTLHAPLAANLNHHGTVFGGSQYAAAAIAGWAVIKLALAEVGLAGDAVITHADVSYKRPVGGDFALTASLRERAQFIDRCRGHHNATALVDARIHYDTRLAMRLEANFYVTLQDGSEHRSPA